MMYQGTYAALLGLFFITWEFSRDVYIWIKISCLFFDLNFLSFNVVFYKRRKNSILTFLYVHWTVNIFKDEFGHRLILDVVKIKYCSCF